MSQSAQPSLSKHLRLSSPSAELRNSVMMSGSPPPDPGGGTARSPAHQTGSVDTESFLLEIIQTETGAADLAEALKARRVRDVLKRHGVKIQADDDVGYNSLPMELRDNIRRFAIADVYTNAGVICECVQRPQLAPYACIDSEWRDAVERVTFRRLNLRDSGSLNNEDLELLERYVVGSRRQYLQHICLSVDALELIGEESSEQDKVDAFTSPIHQLFNLFKQWDECGTAGGNLHVEVRTTSPNGWVAQPFSVPLKGLRARLANLPTTAQITHLCVSIWEPIDVSSMLVLLSRMPNLRSIIIMLRTTELSESPEDYGFQTELFFNSLPQTAPDLESLEVECEHDWLDENISLIFCTQALSYSQRLRKFSLMGVHISTLRAVFAPFSTANFNPDAPPPLVWPNLTEFIIGKPNGCSIRERASKLTNQLMLRIGRAVRYMPRIQNLEMELIYYCSTESDSSLGPYFCSSEVVLTLQSPRGSLDHSPLAKLCVFHEGDQNVAENVPSGEVTDLWRESLFHSSNASLEVQATSLTQEGTWVSNGNRVEESEED